MTTILLVEDEVDYRESVRETLTDEGWEIAEAVERSAAITWLRDHPAPDLAIVDLMMPSCYDREGLDICRWLRENQPEIPIIVLTNRAEKEMLILADEHADVVLEKIKTGADELVGTCRELLDRE